ncbi:PAS domain-containing protein [Inhella proteolytica]|uniref:histidine kinase n=1 Tax=Inhella proteolytica TaxID=2795029 RepID=A0A931NEA0_9BURK|nr:PAS domain-containing protein [Inhella proteolytica]MBH9577472.1 PAS domain-containing protein [Inhella proteolytica]
MGEQAQERVLLDAGLRALFDADLPVGLALLDRELRYVELNQALADYNGVSLEQMRGRSVAEVLPDAFPVLEPRLRAVLDDGAELRGFQVQIAMPGRPGELADWEASYLPVRQGSGPVLGVLVQAVNVTLQRRAARALEETEGRSRRVLDSLFAFVGVTTPDGLVVQINRVSTETAGIHSEEVVGRPVWETHWWNHDPQLQDWLRSATARAARGEQLRRDVEVRMKGASRVTIDLMIEPLRNEQGEITHLVHSAIDVSDRVASEARFRSVFETAPDGLALVNAQGRLSLVNRSLARLFGYSEAELLGRPVSDLVGEGDRGRHEGLMQAFLRAPEARAMAGKRHVVGRRGDGRPVQIEVGLNPIPSSEDPQVLITVSDIGERLRAQALIQAALNEKTVLLQEVHHRVKNNLQIIASLLSLQTRHADASTQSALRDSQSRVMAMSLTHQLLYELNDFSALELGPYLRRLTGLVHAAFAREGQQVELQVEAPEEGLRIDLQQAVPCALVINELLTNCFKHAFPDGRRGQVWLRASCSPQRRVRLELQDNGIGLPPGVRPGQGGSLGFQLVPLLADQLEAEVTLFDGPGTRFAFEFPLPPAQEAPDA